MAESYLWGGQPNPTVDTTSTSTNTYPAWLQQHINALIGKASTYAGEEYQKPTFARIAGFDPMQTQAFGAVNNMQGDWAPYVDAASGKLKGIGGTPGMTAAQPYFDAAFDGPTPLETAQPLIDEANQRVGIETAEPFAARALETSGLDTGGDLISRGATSTGGLGAAAQYLQPASARLPSMIGDYMSPYTDAVVDDIADLGARNLSEKLLPTVNDTFTRAGQFGSSRHGDFTGRAVRDTNEAILAEQNRALQAGYGLAGQQFQTDQQRLAGMGATAGQLGEAGAGRQITGGQGLGQLAEQYGSRIGSLGIGLGQLGETAANRTADLAKLSGDLAAGQRNAELQAAGTAGQIGGQDAQTQINAANAQAGLGQLGQTMGLRDAAALEAAGQTQQAQAQRNLDLQLSDFNKQTQYPAEMANFMSSIIRGLPYNTAQTTQATAPATQSQMAPSALSQLAGAGLGLYGVSQAYPGLFKRRGGAVHRPSFRARGLVAASRHAA